jgi:hypothetical protein
VTPPVCALGFRESSLLGGAGWATSALGVWALFAILLGGCSFGQRIAGAGGGVRLGWIAGMGGARCVEASPRTPLPEEVPESSGAVRALPSLPLSEGGFWTHNDSGWPGLIFRVGLRGELLDTVRLPEIRPVDWEDMAAGPCLGMDGSRCLFLADTGDNRETRAELRIHQIPEPSPGDTVSATVSVLRVKLPHGPRDIEAMAIVGHGTILLVTKGRHHPVEVYALHADAWRAGSGPQVAVRVQQLTRAPARMSELVVGGTTGAASIQTSAGGWLVAVRSYEDIRLFTMRAGDAERPQLRPIPGWRINLRPLREAQGEAVAFLGGDSLLVTSERGLAARVGSFQILHCSGLESADTR